MRQSLTPWSPRLAFIPCKYEQLIEADRKIFQNKKDLEKALPTEIEIDPQPIIEGHGPDEIGSKPDHPTPSASA